MATIPGIERKIKQTIKKLGLKKTDSIKAAINHPAKRFYYTRALDRQGRPVFFKARIRTSSYVRKTFAREIWLTKKLSQYRQYPLYKNIRHYYQSGQGRNFDWLLTEYASGQMLGERYRLNLDYLNSRRLAQAVAFLKRANDPGLNRRLRQARGTKILPRRGYGKIKRHFDEFKRYFKDSPRPPITSRQLQKAESRLTAAKALINKARYLKHGDCQPPNFIGQKDEIVVIDWELARLAHPLSDFCFLWVHLWRYPRYQKQLLGSINEVSPELDAKQNRRLFQAYALWHEVLQIKALNEFFNNIDEVKLKPRPADIRDRRLGLKRHLTNFKILLKKNA